MKLVAGLPFAASMSADVALLSSDFVEPNTNGRTKSLTDAALTFGNSVNQRRAAGQELEYTSI